MKNENKVSPEQDPWLTNFFDEMKQGLYSGGQCLLPPFSDHHFPRYGEEEEELRQGHKPINASGSGDKEITNCRAELNQLVPFKYTWAWDKYLTASSTARVSHLLTQNSTKEIDVPSALEKLVETTDTYIPEPLRNVDGTPCYFHTSMSEDERDIMANESSDDAIKEPWRNA